MRNEVSEEEWLELVRGRWPKEGGNGVLLEVYYEIMHKTHEYRFFVENGIPCFPIHRTEVK